ncbi:MAG: fructosamine kinase family protein [Chromatiaceae bacterium]|nr:MAG: fructosamine kinase family protein [Chromatiaceae bacterium]
MTDWQAIAGQIASALGQRFEPGPARALGGGCINRAALLTDGGERIFVKLNCADRLEMFAAEAAGLEAMAATGSVRVPRPVCTGVAGGEAFVAMEYLELGTRGDSAAAGEQLAAMHRATADRFGWERDNTIGSTPQPNGWQADWPTFWQRQRLGFQLELAARNGYGGRLQRRGERLLAGCPALLGHTPPPALLHGDLWGGNIGYDQRGAPVLFDPAVYYGDREADLAMTELFGGFGPAFHAAYAGAWPLPTGYPVRRTLYNLYHILNHLNLFGSGYLGQAEGMIDRLLAELG